MFLSNELIQLVFAEENDVFYGEDLTELDLEQYLWLRLHRSRYAAVYFLRALPREGSFSVRCFAGDRKCRPYDPDQQKGLKWLLGKKENELGKWMLDQLRDRSDPAALICPMADFCAVAGQESWEPLLRELASDKRRSGVLVLTAPPEAEESTALLLQSKVFDWLGDTAILDARKGNPQNLYGFLRRRKTPEACVFLNNVTEESLEGLLRCAELSRPGPILTEEDRSAAAAYLSGYLRTPRLQREEPLFSHNLPGAYLRYKELRSFLDQDKVWKSLILRSRSEEKPEFAGSSLLMCRSTDGKIGDCIERVFAMTPKVISDPKISGQWSRVLGSLMTPSPVPPDPRLAESMERLTLILTAAEQRNAEECLRVLEALEVLCRVLGEPELGEEKLDRCLRLEQSTDLYVKMQDQLNVLEEDIALLSGQTGNLAAAKLAVREKERAHMANMRDKSLQIIQTLRENLSVSNSMADVSALQGDVEKLVAEFEKKSADGPEEKTGVPEEEPLDYAVRAEEETVSQPEEPRSQPAGSPDEKAKFSPLVPKLH